MKSLKINILFLPLFLLLFGCVDEKQFDNTPEGNFDACWNIINEKYCFFGYKEIDWQEVYHKYRPLVGPGIGRDSLFNVLADMLAELQDGHVNLYAPFNQARYWAWFEDYPENFDAKVQRKYLGNDYLIAAGIKYIILPDSIGYAYYSSFGNGVGELNMDYVLAYFRNCKGIIFDVRNNGGGMLSYVNTIASRFTDEKIISGYITHKTGKGHNDFSKPYPMHLSPSERIQWDRPVALLTNRHTFSAANNFVSVMRLLPNVTTIGDKTGGGSGLPFSSELPIGWSIRFSASPIYDAEMNHTEFGIDPDIKVSMTLESMLQGKDDIIESARNFILNTP